MPHQGRDDRSRVVVGKGAVRRAIQQLFGDHRRRRVAVVAFVGVDADTYLPHPRGIQLYCWPKAGGTNPDAVRSLIKLGVKAHFVDRLHAKVFWASGKGAVIGSANLTNNALGDGGLIEAAVYLPPGSFDIDGFVSSLSLVKNFDETLKRLRHEHVLFYLHNEFASKQRTSRAVSRLPSFVDWWDEGAAREDWRFGWYESNANPPRDALDDYQEHFGRRTYAEWLASPTKSAYPVGRFVLSMRLDVHRGHLHPMSPRWWVPGFLTPSRDPEWRRDYPWAVFADRRIPAGTRPPFSGKDPLFLKALVTVLERHGGVRRLQRDAVTTLSPAELAQIASSMRRR